jgi:tetratricopeptide (TPR) repeat protein
MAEKRLYTVCVAVALCGLAVGEAAAAEVQQAEALYRAGKYSQCARIAGAEIERGEWEEEWPILKAQAELAQGKYRHALATIEEALDGRPWSVQLRMLARTIYLYNGKEEAAAAQLDRLERYVASDPRQYSGAAERVALGRFLLERNADPRQVLELVYDPLRKESPQYVGVYLASAELALDKYDNALAAETLRAAPKEAAKDPQFHYLVARAYAPDDAARAEAALNAALDINPRHVDSLLMRADRLVDAEQYDAADDVLKQVLSVNANHPTAWAYKAVLAHLAADPAGEKAARDQALSLWKTNPEVDHLIGRKLSEKYRFAEGAGYQRRALEFDANYRPARLQLSQDLLRLGEEEEGWRLADEVAKADAYDVVAFNLVTLEKEIAKFRTIRGDGLIVRMDAREAQIYGERVLELLQRARETLCAKYDVRLEQPIVIEIFPQQKDFAVRTFGMPGVAGFLGVCFGRVITANSPASQGENAANWEAVLWHEFCHVVTLHKTRNKMPRWLSEGISVYEERQANSSWGQAMSSEYRELILDGKLTPVSELSSAFLAPPSPMHLQFAYFESSLVVEYLVEQFGLEALQKILADLGDGMEINEALIRHTVPLGRLDADFAEFARSRAEQLAPTATWDKPEVSPMADAQALAEWLKDNPRNVPGLKRYARQLLRERNFEKALDVATHLREVFPDDPDEDNADVLMAAAHRGLSDTARERIALDSVASRIADATPVYLRLMETAAAADDWEAVATNARRMLAVNPLVPAPHRYLAQAAEKLGQRDEAVRANRALLLFETTDVAETHFRLAQLLRDSGDSAAAKRHVLLALEEAPRFLDAHKLLLELVPGEPASTSQATKEAAPAELPRDENATAPATERSADEISIEAEVK